jgi:putative ABC transport system permease protein
MSRFARGFRRVFRVPFSRLGLRRDVDAELRFHIEGRIEELMSKDLSRDEAEREARARFGDIDRIESEVRSIDRVTRRRQSWREHVAAIAFDVRYALRGMARRPLYTLIVVLTLALGIGANTAIFSLVDAVLLHPLPTPGLDRLVVIQEDLLALNLIDAQLSPGEALDLFARKDLFPAASAYAGWSVNLTGPGEPQRIAGIRTLGDFFGVFGVRPYLGRLYRPEDSRPGSPHGVVLSYAFWQHLLGGDPKVLGRSIDIDGGKIQVVGVLPANFQYPRSAQIYVPFELDPRWLTNDARKSLFMTVVARPRNGLSGEQLATALQLEVGRWRGQYSEGYDPKTFVLHARPFVNYLAGDLRPVLLALTGAVTLVLLIACANVGSLQLVLAGRRAKEIAVRFALGAGRSTILRWLFAETLVLAIAGGVLGIGIGAVILRFVTRLNASQYLLLAGVHLDWRVLGFTAGVVLGAALLFGVFPALRASRVDLQDTLKDSARGSSMALGRHRFLQGSVVVQVALTLMLLLASALTVRSLARVLQVDPGFRAAQLTTMRITLPGARYGSNAARSAFYDALIERLRAIPGVESVGLVAYLPFNGGTDSSPFELPGRPELPNEPARHANTEVVAGDYFRAMGIPLLRGRAFGTADENGAESVIVDEYLAKSFFGADDPIGKPIIHNNRATIIGVVGNVTQEYLGQPPHPTIYHFYQQEPWISGANAVIRSRLPDERVVTMARSAVREIDPLLPVFDVKSMTERISASLTPRRLAMYVLIGFAALSLALAMLGIYGVISYSTAQRTHEIGIRMALGAEPREVTRMVITGALTLAGIGVTAGMVLFLGAGRIVATLLYGVGPRDPLTIVGGIVLLGVVSLLASYIPARRAARVDPLAALRNE